MELPISITGTVKAIDSVTQTVITESSNDFHLENLSKSIVKSLCRMESGFIEEIHFGNGATVTTETGGLYYKPPNITGSNAKLHNYLTYKVINNRSGNFTSDPNKNYIRYEKIQGNNTTRLIIHFTLDYAEPKYTTTTSKDLVELKYSDVDDILSSEKFTFDEMGLFAVDSTTKERYLLTHWITKPIDKQINRAMEFVYTIDFQLTK